jgi:hypothetical protein
MAPKSQKSLKKTNPPLMRAIYLAIIVGIIAAVTIVTLESIISVIREASTSS